MSTRPPRVLTRSFPLMPAMSTLSDSVQLLGFGLLCSLTHRLQPICGFCSSGQSFALRRTIQPPQSGFLQIPRHRGYLCLQLTLPAAGRVRDFHPRERALAGRTTSLQKALAEASAFCWWGRVDSNHRRHSQQIYSLSPLATREHPRIVAASSGSSRFRPRPKARSLRCGSSSNRSMRFDLSLRIQLYWTICLRQIVELVDGLEPPTC